jgi:DNA-binding IclR family transcriptional regulator
LVRERLVRQRTGDRHYMPGSMLFELGLSSLPEWGELQHAARSRLEALAKRTSGVAFLCFRSEDDFVCALRVGSTRLDARPCAVFPGTRRPLVTTASGMAVLVAMSEEEARATARRSLVNLAGYSDANVKGIRRMIQRSFAERFAINAQDTVPGVNAFGLALQDANGTPFASITLAGPARLFPLERLPELRHLLEATADGLRAAHS